MSTDGFNTIPIPIELELELDWNGIAVGPRIAILLNSIPTMCHYYYYYCYYSKMPLTPHLQHWWSMVPSSYRHIKHENWATLELVVISTLVVHPQGGICLLAKALGGIGIVIWNCKNWNWNGIDD